MLDPVCWVEPKLIVSWLTIRDAHPEPGFFYLIFYPGPVLKIPVLLYPVQFSKYLVPTTGSSNLSQPSF